MFPASLDGCKIRMNRWFPYATATCRGVRYLCRWQHLLAFSAIIAVLWQVENYRGVHRFETVEKRLTEAGVDLDWQDYHRRPKVAPENNIAKQPPFNTIRVEPAGDSYFADIESALYPLFQDLPRELLSKRHEGDLEEWANRLDPPAPDGPSDEPTAQRVLEATAHLEPLIEEAHQALQLTDCQWMEIDFDALNMSPVPQISDMTDTCRALTALLYTRALAYLELDEPDKAAREIHTVLAFSQITRFESGSLVCALVAVATRSQVCNDTLAFVLRHENWNDTSLQSLQAALADNHLLAQVDRGMKAELASIMSFAKASMNKEPWTQEYWREGSSVSIVGPDVEKGEWLKACWRGLQNRFYHHLPLHMPRGWHGQNMARIAEWWEQNILSLYDAESRQFRITEPPNLRGLFETRTTPYNFLAQIATPQISNFYQSAARTQTQWDLLSVACSLERYRLAEGDYPERLGDLVEKGFADELPHDYVTGEAPSYRRGNDSFTLASLDWERSGIADALVSIGYEF